MFGSTDRVKAASRAALLHLVGSVFVVALAATLVLWVWYPYPYNILSGGRHLFLILVAVDVTCGPVLTLILFNPRKSRRELVMDMTLVVALQVVALIYGVHTAYQARPLFLVHDVDLFRAVTVGDYGDADVRAAMAQMDASLRPHLLRGPVTVEQVRDSHELY